MNPEQIRAAIRAALAQRAIHERTIRQITGAIGAGMPTTAQAASLRADRSAIVAIDAELDQHQASLQDAQDDQQRHARAAEMRRQMGGARVTAEPRTYGERSGESFVRDAFTSRFLGDTRAGDRLARSQREAADSLEQRAVGTSGFAGLVIPQYLVDAAALALRSGRPIANSAAKLPLPEQGMSLIVPKSTTGAGVGSQATEHSAVLNTDEVWANITVPVATIAGQQVLSRQSIERGSPQLDALVISDLAAAYAAEVERQIVNGSGASGQMLGILSTAGVATSTAFGAAVTAAAFMSKVAGAIASIAAAGSGIAATYIAMHPRRWAWLLSQNDSTGRPLVSPIANGPTSAAASTAPGAYGGDDDPVAGMTIVGYLHGLPVLTSTAIPTNLGGGSTEDVVIVYDNRQALLWEDSGMPKFLNFEQPYAASLGVLIVGYGYAGFTAARYPSGFAQVGGADSSGTTGLQAPAF
ncbi:phage major capsid protein, HK97 family [Geodermatophilus siccatus]|uniref:Phage major capsid protein, HK97 family n=1 Tax=Geodermatophilus siccatus TaxID=1137991 RepID=A0A1G9PSH0_9ACTN|nr:phage major capsid protein [Geodermatophilus siccatus]SDM01716.1 phage major capsid protein, HK97 family [Geodermatophilus siccatus]